MRFFFVTEKNMATVVQSAIERAQIRVGNELRGVIRDVEQADALKKEIVDLQITRDKMKETFDRREREIEHLIGLERRRQEQEMANAIREAKIEVAQQNLEADKARFKAEMDFQRERLTGEVDSLRKMVEQLLQAIPSATIFADIRKGG
jgi:hypothetical protein